MMESINKEQLSILRHTSQSASGALYCGDSPDMQGLVGAGLMAPAGRKSFVPEPYFALTNKGRAVLSAGAVARKPNADE